MPFGQEEEGQKERKRERKKERKKQRTNEKKNRSIGIKLKGIFNTVEFISFHFRSHFTHFACIAVIIIL